MNLAAGSTVQRQSATLIAALKTRVADQSSDACQYFRIIAEGCLLLVSFSLFPSSSLATFYPVNSLPSPSFRPLPSSFMSSPLLPRVCTQSQTSVAGKAKRCRIGFLFLNRPDDALMRPGLCGWTEAPDFARDRHE